MATAARQLPRTAWVHWWALTARLASTCRALRDALLGPEAGELYSWTHITVPTQELGLHRLLASQARHARSASMEGGGWPEAEQLQAVFASLSAVDELILLDFGDQEEVECLSALSGRPTQLSFSGERVFGECAALQQLQHLRLSLSAVQEPDLQALAGWLPPLQRLQLSIWAPEAAAIDRVPVDSFEPLSLLRVEQLSLCYDLSYTGCNLPRVLRQLSSVKLWSLELNAHTSRGCVWLKSEDEGSSGSVPDSQPSGAAQQEQHVALAPREAASALWCCGAGG